MNPSKENPVICWWSGGVTSAVACKIAIDTYGVENCRVIMIDTYNEDDDTYRFLSECENWYGCLIERISAVRAKEINVNGGLIRGGSVEVYGKTYSSIEDVWQEFDSLNTATGAICSSVLKRDVRKDFQRKNKYCAQIFGFEISETRRADNLKNNYPMSMPVFPLIEFGLTKKDCMRMIQAAGIEIPKMYRLGFHNNNCFKTGCVQGGIGYWKKMQKEFPEKFLAMAKMEHELTNSRGAPVTCLKDQSKRAKESGIELVFLLPHPDYPSHKDLSMMNGRSVEPLAECNGFCGTDKSLKTKF